MADYFAVLKRTLSGFTDPKPQLRTKLYERARTTIKRQLEGRNPPLSDDALTAELDKLEKAITDIEQGYDPDYSSAPSSAVAENAAAEPTLESANKQEPIDLPTLPVKDPEPEVVEATEAEETSKPDQSPAPMPDLEIDIPLLDPEPASEPLEPVIDPVDEWAKEFISTEPVVPEQTVPAVTEPVVATAIPAAVSPPPIPPVIPAPISLPEAPVLPEQPVDLPLPELEIPPIPVPVPPSKEVAGDALSIPPAPGFGARKSKRPKKRGWGKWLLALLIIALLGAAATFGWDRREALMERFGLSEMFDNPTRPKPVKTISIKPDPKEPETGSDVTVTPSIEQPKSEKRLTAEGVEVEPAVTLPVVVPTTPAPETPATNPQPGALPVAQNAILYEKGGTAAENSIDTGRVVWSIVQEEPAAGLPKEPAIRGRVEIPSRKMILIMTIKRNGDKSLPASHLIELVFAVPDDFSGGSVGQINRFVFKESEQGRGEGLVAVPARIAEGIFLVALNNLDSAIKKNETLMLTRDWIDIPMQYRTGRRALITIEKGLPGERVFKEALEAWEKLK
ncbi:MAG: hypothetical protein V3V02_02015 [Rhizobiaceae bacterium]